MNRAEAHELLLREIRERRTYLESSPATVNIEFTGRCPVKPPCTYCVGKNAPDYQDPGHIATETLDTYWPYLLAAQRVNDCTFGEFQLYPGHEDLVTRLAEAGVPFGFTTIGQLLTESRSRFLIRHADTVEFAISLNAATEPTYRKYHGTGFDIVIRNLRRFIALHTELRPGRPLPVVLSCIVMRGNRHEIIPFLRMAAELGIDRIILRHLFDMRAGRYAVDSFQYHFVYEEERLTYADYLEIRSEINAIPEFAALTINYEWKPEESFIREQSEPDVDIPCLFPWKFLCIRPLHDSYTPCCFLKKAVEKPSEKTVQEVWNGEVMVGMRTELAAGRVPHFCRKYGDACPLVLETHRLVQINPASRPVHSAPSALEPLRQADLSRVAKTAS
jgi:MoaA/NifB/PqqE/SkfB family radical SAM enzyme